MQELYVANFKIKNFIRYLSGKETIARMSTDEHISYLLSELNGNVLEIGSTKTRNYYKEQAVNVEKFVTSNLHPYERSILQVDIKNIPFSDNYFDGILCFNVLEHVQQTNRAIDECYRVLKPNGILLLIIPFMFPIHAAPEDYFRFTPSAIKEFTAKFSEVSIFQIGEKWHTTANILQGPNWELGKKVKYNPFILRLIGLFFYIGGCFKKKVDNYALFYSVKAVK